MTPQAERIASLDVLRGIGIMGILAVNAPFFAQPFAALWDPNVLGPMDAASRETWAAVSIFFERKFVSLFSMLFGASILLVGGENGDATRQPHLNRRLGWLALFGLVHGTLIWYGDILLTYAIAGCIAAQFRSWRPVRLFVVGGLIFLVFALFEAGSYWLIANMPDAMRSSGMGMDMLTAERALRDVQAFRGSLGQVQAANFSYWAFAFGNAFFFIPSTLGLMLVGMGLFRTGVLTGKAPVAVYLGLVAMGGAALAAIGWTVQQVLATDFEATSDALVSATNGLAAPLATLGYLSLVCLLLKTPLRLLFRPVAAMGQMAFTNYITQSLIMTGIYWGARGMGLFGTMSLADQVHVVAAIWLLQLVWSPVWLSMFRYGPLEWVWRRLTYKGPVPFRRRGSA